MVRQFCFDIDFEKFLNNGEKDIGGMRDETIGIFMICVMKKLKIMITQQEEIKQLEDKVKDRGKCKQVPVELKELKSTAKEHDRKSEANHGKKFVEESRAYLGGRVVYQANKMLITQRSENMEGKGRQKLGNNSGAEEELRAAGPKTEGDQWTLNQKQLTLRGHRVRMCLSVPFTTCGTVLLDTTLSFQYQLCGEWHTATHLVSGPPTDKCSYLWITEISAGVGLALLVPFPS